MIEHGPLLERLLAGEFICAVSDESAFRKLQDEEVREQIDIYLRPLNRRLATDLTPIAGATEALAALSHYSMGVVSNGPENKVRTSLATVGLTEVFGNRLFSGYTANCWKPDPCLYLHAASIMQTVCFFIQHSFTVAIFKYIALLGL